MNLVDQLRWKAQETGKPVEAWLNGIPVRVQPDGHVDRREHVAGFVYDEERGRYVRREAGGEGG